MQTGPSKTYEEFLATKRLYYASTGIPAQRQDVHHLLFPFQADLTVWAARKGKAAIFADTGLGKTFMQLEWARLLGQRTLIVAPLSVAQQTIREAEKIGLTPYYVRSQGEAREGINITNYEMVSHFDPSSFGAVVLDESSILKALDGKTRAKLTEMFQDTPYRLCCTATPAPNDIAEIANHAEFLGIMSRPDMLATFFVHDDDGWRLKGHAQDAFFRWLASWSMSLTNPSDLGYSDDGFLLPPLTIELLGVASPAHTGPTLFPMGLKGIHDRMQTRRATLGHRVEAVAQVVNNDTDQWLLWCGLNDEGRMLQRLIPDSVLVEGQDTLDKKARAIEAFQLGKVRVLITKPKIAGFGLNLQNTHKMAFVGLSDSWESYYQCIRRSWRFGQSKPVQVKIVLSELEKPIYDNVMRKEKEAQAMRSNLIANIKDWEKTELGTQQGTNGYHQGEMAGENYTLLLGDSAERMAEIGVASVDLSVFSPPFLSLYTYSPTERDIGNSRGKVEFFEHFGFIIKELLRVTKPGRLACVHVAQVPAMLVRDGYIGMKDFRGATIQAFEDYGWIYHGEVCIDKDPQAQAIRTKSKSLLFTQLKKDSSWLRPALADYILVFRKPGENQIAVHPDISNNQWIEWARPIWYGIRESDTLNVREARSDDDERHIAPLQLETIERCIRLWSNPGELVLSPFAGIGSEGYVALGLARRFIGIELKAEYYNIALKNLERANTRKAQTTLF